MTELNSLMNANAAMPMTILGIYIHGFFLILAVGLPYLVLIYEALGILRKDKEYMEAAKRTSMVWAISFGFGAVTGTLVEFGLVQIWSGTILAIGSFFFIPLYFELFAFLIEVTFLAAYLYTWNKFKNPWTHWALGLGVLIGSNASAWLILTVNAWMQTPWGTGTLVQNILPWTPELGPSKVNATALITIYNVLPKTGSIVLADPKTIQALGYLLYDPLIVLFNPNALATVIHTILATIIIAAFETASVYSFFYLKGPRVDLKNFYFKAAKIAYGVGGITSIIMPLSGDFMARIVYEFQYVKFLIMEGFNGGKDPLIGLLTEFNPSYNFLGFKDLMMYTNKSIDPNAVIQTIKEAQQIQPLITIFYYSMVISGIVLFLFGVAFLGIYSKKIDKLVRIITRMSTEKFIVYSSFVAMFLGLIAASTGWAVREIGRHPWTIYGLIQYQQVITPNTITPEFSLMIIIIEILVLIGGLIALYYVPTKSLNEIEIVRGG